MPRSYAEARDHVVSEARRVAAPRVETVPLDEAGGRILAEDVLADRDQPAFDRSTRDGYALRSGDAGPRRLVGEAAAGSGFGGEVGPGECVAIMTGAPLPRGADAVVMIEHTRRQGSEVVLERGVEAGENVVAAGSELARGALALARGVRIDAGGVAMLAQVGAARPRVFARPTVALIGTGDELVSVEETPAPFQIRNSNVSALAAQVRRAGGLPLSLPTARDDRAALRGLIERGLQADLLVLSGGVSMGKYDLVEGVLGDLGAKFFFDYVDIRPGKPVVFGHIGEKLFFGLPGNPVSTAVTFELFGRPVVEVLGGLADPTLRLAHVRLAAEVRQRALPLTVFLPAALEGALAEASARTLPSQGSGDIAAWARARGFVVVPPGVTHIPAGEWVPFLPA